MVKWLIIHKAVPVYYLLSNRLVSSADWPMECILSNNNEDPWFFNVIINTLSHISFDIPWIQHTCRDIEVIQEILGSWAVWLAKIIKIGLYARGLNLVGSWLHVLSVLGKHIRMTMMPYTSYTIVAELPFRSFIIDVRYTKFHVLNDN